MANIKMNIFNERLETNLKRKILKCIMENEGMSLHVIECLIRENENFDWNLCLGAAMDVGGEEVFNFIMEKLSRKFKEEAENINIFRLAECAIEQSSLVYLKKILDRYELTSGEKNRLLTRAVYLLDEEASDFLIAHGAQFKHAMIGLMKILDNYGVNSNNFTVSELVPMFRYIFRKEAWIIEQMNTPNEEGDTHDAGQ